jgi:cellulose synthase operon protein C
MAASGLLWRRTILEQAPSHLPTLRRVASDLIAAGRHEELEPIAIETARALTGGEAVAHAMLSARLRLAAGTWESTREPVEIAYGQEPRGAWALRQMAAHARAKGEHALAIEADRQLIERTDRPSEAATLSMRASESAAAAGEVDAAKQLLLSAVELMPEHLVAHLALAHAAEESGDFGGAAAALEAAASASVTDEEKSRNLYRAATLWQDKAGDPSRARSALEAVATIDPAYEDVFSRLQAIYIAEGARQELASLLEARLARVTDPAERVELEVLRGRALADVGDPAAAKRALAAALDANPDHVEALSAFADVCAAEEDWSSAEQAWIRLARLATEPAQQIAIYNKLGELYDDKLPNAERAELSYQEILKREPGSEPAREKLVALYKRTGDTAKALEQQTILINSAEAPEAKCKRTTELATIYEVMGDQKKAEATLLGARKTYPKDDVALVALAEFYQRTSQSQAANVLLDRAVTDARRALGAGRFEPYLFSTLATVAELRGKADSARVAKVAVAALEGEPALLEGIGGTAGDPALDELLAPEVLTPAFRELLQSTGAVLDTAVPFDLQAIRATPLPPQQAEISDEVQSLAGFYGLTDVRVLVSAALGAVCVAATAHPPTIVFGQALALSPRTEVRTFLVHRALKVLQVNAGAFARTAPIDLWPLLAAFLRAYSPGFAPQGVDAGKLNDFYGRVTRAMAGKPDPQLGILAADVIGSIGNRASTLGTAVNGWGNRTGFLAVGDANAALSGIAWSSGNTNAPPQAGKDRLTWIGRNAEARELMVFTVSDAFAAARTRAGVGDE